MRRSIANITMACAIFLPFAVDSAAAEGTSIERVFGLWQSGDTYLEFSTDGTFFVAEQSEEHDVYGTFFVRGDAVEFIYGVGANMLTTHKTVYFPSGDETRMQLVDAQGQSLLYRKLRDF